MAFNLNKIKSMFGGGAASAPEGGANFDPSRTVSIIEKLRTAGEGDAPDPLPLVGHLPSRRQMTISIVSIVVCLGLFLITVLVNIRSSNHNAV